MSPFPTFGDRERDSSLDARTSAVLILSWPPSTRYAPRAWWRTGSMPAGGGKLPKLRVLVSSPVRRVGRVGEHLSRARPVGQPRYLLVTNGVHWRPAKDGGIRPDAL